MEHEDREQIPWSSLVPDVGSSPDRRWYAVGVLVAVVVVAWFGYRIIDGDAQPSAVPVIADPTPTSVLEASTSPVEPTMVVAEAELMSADPSEESDRAVTDRTRLIAAAAEWFVTDYFTVDESAETERSVREALATDLRDADLPHDEEGPDTFVEWARAAIVEAAVKPYEATVLFRTIRSMDGGWLRDPVRGAVVTFDLEAGRLAVTALPRVIDAEVALSDASD